MTQLTGEYKVCIVPCSMKLAYHIVDPSKLDDRGTEEPLLLDLKSCSNTINVNRYCLTLEEQFTKVKNKHHGKVINSINMLHDTANPHMFHRVQDNRCSHPEILHIS
jgi:hypothetical protein